MVPGGSAAVGPFGFQRIPQATAILRKLCPGVSVTALKPAFMIAYHAIKNDGCHDRGVRRWFRHFATFSFFVSEVQTNRAQRAQPTFSPS
jgi:hypothetical protein